MAKERYEPDEAIDLGVSPSYDPVDVAKDRVRLQMHSLGMASEASEKQKFYGFVDALASGNEGTTIELMVQFGLLQPRVLDEIDYFQNCTAGEVLVRLRERYDCPENAILDGALEALREE